jgi:ketosteroid isomerase-like protein
VSQEDVAIVRRWFDGFARGEVSPELCHPEIEIRNWAESPAPGPFRGHEGLRRWWATVNDPDIVVDPRPFEVVEMIDVGDGRIVVIQRFTAKARYSGLEIDERWGAVVTVGDGKILSAVGYPSPEEAKRAAGLKVA